jgi:hypothetical protein
MRPGPAAPLELVMASGLEPMSAVERAEWFAGLIWASRILHHEGYLMVAQGIQELAMESFTHGEKVSSNPLRDRDPDEDFCPMP